MAATMIVDVTATAPASQIPSNGLARISFTATDSGGLACALLYDDGARR